MDISDQITGMSKAFDQYIQGNVQNQQQTELAQNKSAIDLQQEKAMASYKQNLEGVMTPEMGQHLFSQVSPEFGQAAAKALSDFKQAKGRDMTIKEAGEAMDPVMKGIVSLQAKHEKDQEGWTFIGNTIDGKPIQQNKKGELRLADTSNIGGPGKPILPKTSTMPTAQARSTSEFATTMLPHLDEMDKLVDMADKKGLIGPVKGRVFNDFLAGKVGSTGDPDLDKALGELKTFDTLVKSGTMKVHFGSRGGQMMMEHFNDILNASKQSAAAMHGSIKGIRSFMKGYEAAGQPQDASGTSTKASIQENNNNDPLGIRQ